MDEIKISTLLRQSESAILDFKRDQYPFDAATEDQRSELLKDILAFANAWRDSPAYILIGVEEIKGGRSRVVGTTHLLNRNLQNFVESRVNRPITFHYEAMEFESKQIGVISIPVQDRPFYLKKDYGKLKASTVYIRRGDITVIADPDEIAEMGAKLESGRVQPNLQFALSHGSGRMPLDSNPIFNVTCYRVPKDHDISAYGLNYGLMANIRGDNEDFYSDCAKYMRDILYLRPLQVSVTNLSRVTAEHIVVRLECEQHGIQVVSASSLVRKPAKDDLSKMLPNINLTPGVSVHKNSLVTEVKVESGDIQPGTTSWSHHLFYVGSRTDGEYLVKILISGHNLAEPLRLFNTLIFRVQNETVSVDDLISWANELA